MNPKKIKYGTREYKEAYENNQVVNSYNGDTYEVSLPEVLITPRNNLDLGQVVRNGTSKVARPIIRVAETALDFSPLSPALAMGRIGAAASNYKKTGNKALLKKAMSSAAFEALPYINIKALKLPLSEADDIVKTITKEKFGIDKISLSTPKKGVIADIELSPAEEFGRKWMRPEYINVAKTEQGKGLSNVLYDEGIKHSKSKGYDGVLSGEVLLQPEKTVKTQRRFNGPQMKNYIDEYNYPIKGMESPKDPNLSKRIIEAYNKANEYRTTVGRELLNMTQSLFRNYKPVLATQ
jgi:hypothetical protein